MRTLLGIRRSHEHSHGHGFTDTCHAGIEQEATSLEHFHQWGTGIDNLFALIMRIGIRALQIKDAVER